MFARAKLKSPDLTIALDAHAAPTLDHAEHRTVSLTIRFARKACRQALHECGHDRHGLAAGCRIYVTQLDAVPRIDVSLIFELVQCFVRALVGVAGDG